MMKESLYVMASIAVFAVIGMLTGYLHGHGEIAGTVCGGLSGLILAIIVPAIHGNSFMSKHRYLQILIAALALIPFFVIICWMYDVMGIPSLLMRIMSLER